GAWNGFGDGLVLYQLLGPWRIPVAIGAGLITCGAGFIGAREVVGALAGTLPGSPRTRVIGTVIAALLGGGFHAALTAGELAIRRDPTYAATMQPERERVVERELAQWEHDQAQQGAPVTQDQKRVEQHR